MFARTRAAGTSVSLTRPDESPVASVEPSGENARAVMPPRWRSTAPRRRRWPQSQTVTTPPKPPAAACRPSLENATSRALYGPSVRSGFRSSPEAASRDPDGRPVSADRQGARVRGEGHRRGRAHRPSLDQVSPPAEILEPDLARDGRGGQPVPSGENASDQTGDCWSSLAICPNGRSSSGSASRSPPGAPARATNVATAGKTSSHPPDRGRRPKGRRWVDPAFSMGLPLRDSGRDVRGRGPGRGRGSAPTRPR